MVGFVGLGHFIENRYPQDAHDRQWEGWMSSSWTAISTNSSIPSKDFDVPSSVLQTAAVTSAVNSSIDVFWSDTNKSTTYFLVLHFSELQVLQNNSLRELAIYANGAQILDPITPKYLSHSYASFTLTGRTDYIVSLKSTPNATLPLIVNAWERYTIVPVIWLPTYYGDGILLSLSVLSIIALLIPFVPADQAYLISLLIIFSNEVSLIFKINGMSSICWQRNPLRKDLCNYV
jgi:Malectin-like domain